MGVLLSPRSTENDPQLQNHNTIDSRLPELYAAVIVFAVKARTYFKANSMYIPYSVYIRCYFIPYTDQKLGTAKFGIALKSFDIEFQPFIEEIDAKEKAIREIADAATMERVKSMVLHMVLNIIGQNLMKVYRHGYPYTRV